MYSNVHKNTKTIANELKSSNVQNIVHLIEIEYDKNEFMDVQFHDLIFNDGGYPNDDVLIKWLKLLDYFNINSMKVGIHCKASLGRAPLLIAIGLIYYGLTSEDAIYNIRKIINNAINTIQISYLNKNEKKIKKHNKINNIHNSCIIC